GRRRRASGARGWRFARIGLPGILGRGQCRGPVFPSQDVGFTPAVAGRADEALGLVGAEPAGDGLLRHCRLGFGEVAREAHEAQIPADTDGAGTELAPMRIDVGDVLELEPRAVSLGRERDVDPTDAAAEFPGGFDAAVAFAFGDGAA